MPNTRDLILSAMERNSIEWPDVAARVQRDEAVSEDVAGALLTRVHAGGMPIAVAAAIITLIADKRVVA